ncbi:MAG: hypothetical protein ACKO0V_22155 [bacterium]
MPDHDQTQPDNILEDETDEGGLFSDWPSLLMILAAIAISAWCFWPVGTSERAPEKTIATGQAAPGLWTVDVVTGTPVLGLVQRGWFTWLVLAPAEAKNADELARELQQLEKTWKGLADLDGWRRVVVVSDKIQGRQLRENPPGPNLIPFDTSQATARTWAAWGSAEKVRHVLIEPTGKIILIEPSEGLNPGTLEKISDDLKRRLRAFEGEFDDMPRFSQDKQRISLDLASRLRA